MDDKCRVSKCLFVDRDLLDPLPAVIIRHLVTEIIAAPDLSYQVNKVSH